MPRVIKTVTYNSRAISFRGTAVFASMGKYVTDFLVPFRRPGWVIESGGDENELTSHELVDAPTLAANLCHAQESGLQSDPETAEKVAAWLVKNYRVTS